MNATHSPGDCQCDACTGRGQYAPGLRTIGDIVEACQEGQAVPEQDLRLALLALYYHAQMACRGGSDLLDGAVPRSALIYQVQARDNFDRHFRILRATPQKWLGDRWTPGTEENRKGRELAKKIAKKAGVL